PEVAEIPPDSVEFDLGAFGVADELKGVGNDLAVQILLPRVRQLVQDEASFAEATGGVVGSTRHGVEQCERLPDVRREYAIVVRRSEELLAARNRLDDGGRAAWEVGARQRSNRSAHVEDVTRVQGVRDRPVELGAGLRTGAAT